MADDSTQREESTKNSEEHALGAESNEKSNLEASHTEQSNETQKVAENAESCVSNNQVISEGNKENCTRQENSSTHENGKEDLNGNTTAESAKTEKIDSTNGTFGLSVKKEIKNNEYSTAAESSKIKTVDSKNDSIGGNVANKKGKQLERKLSNYIQNIKLTSSSARLSLGESKEIKEENLLSQSKTVVRFSPVWKQTLAASGSILLTFTAGLTSGYSAILLPQLEKADGPIPSDDNTASWIASMAALPMALGCLIAGWMMEKFGRRNSHYIICVLFLLGWILIACASNLSYMLAGRFLTGLCVGLLGPLGPVYIAESSEPKLRGFFLAGISLAIALGIFVAHLIGTFMTWQWTATISCLFPILSVFLLVLVPESPTWLISKGKIEEGVKAFYWLRGYSHDAKIELKVIIDSKKAVDSEPVPTWREKLANLKSPTLMKPLFIMIIFFITCQFSGVNAVAFYSIQIVEKAVGSGINHYVAMLIIDGLRVVMSVLACIVCKQYGRRPLCLISGIFTAISMVGLSMFLYWKPENMVWLPLTCLMVYIAAISIGLVPLPWIMCGEVFPLKVRGIGSGVSSAVTFTAFFVVVKTVPGMMTNLGEVVTFLIYGITALIGTGILYFILPETKGKSLQEIEDRFSSGRSKNIGPKV